MEIYFLENFTDEQVIGKISLLEADASVQSILVWSSDTDALRSSRFSTFLSSLHTSIFGGIFPEVIYDGKNYSNGCIVAGFPFHSHCVVVPNLSDSSSDFEMHLEKEAEEMHPYFNTTLVFVDGLSKRIGDFVDSLFFSFGSDVNYFGGGCGSLSFQSKPCVITSKGVLSDAAVIAFTHQKISVGVAHGWTSISESIKVTSSAKNVVKELNYKPAFEVYKRIVDNHSNAEITEDNFFDIAKSYPFGLHKLDSESIIRDPIKVENGNLVCVGEVPEGAYLKIYHGNTESLLEGARFAKNLAFEQCSSVNSHVWIVDCVSRALFMGERFWEELQVLKSQAKQMGILSIGEIACSNGLHLDFHNKTTLVGMFE